MAHKIVFRPAALSDLKSLHDYIAEQSGRNQARIYIERIEAACMSLSTFPKRGMVRDDLLPGLRLVGFERRASIAFIVESETVRILRIFYGGRDFPDEWSGR